MVSAKLLLPVTVMCITLLVLGSAKNDRGNSRAKVRKESSIMSAGGITCKVAGKSGKIFIGRNVTDANETDTDTISVELDAIVERNANGADFGCSGKSKHCFQNFATLDFAFSDITEVTYQGLSATMFSYDGVILSVHPYYNS